jgi:hypothetical protein
MDPQLIPFLNFVLNSLIIIVVLLFSKTSLAKIRLMLHLLHNGDCFKCPYFLDARRYRDDLQLPSDILPDDERR